MRFETLFEDHCLKPEPVTNWRNGLFSLQLNSMHEDDISAPKLNDTDPPRMFGVITSSAVNYNNDFVDYLVKQEVIRRVQKNEHPLTHDQINDFRKELVSLIVIHQNPEAAINLRPAIQQPIRQLNG